jgi:hypothetical protein
MLRAAELGNVSAMNSLGNFYTPWGKRKFTSFEKATKWYQKVWENGDPDYEEFSRILREFKNPFENFDLGLRLIIDGSDQPPEFLS